MRKNYFYAILGRITPADPQGTLYRFRVRVARDAWVREDPYRFAVLGSHPEVRRIKRMIEQGEIVIFPVEIGN
jgi:hypothetical protein